MNTEQRLEPVDEGFYFKGMAAGRGISRDQAVELIRLVRQGDATVTVAVTTDDGTTHPLAFQPMQMMFCG